MMFGFDPLQRTLYLAAAAIVAVIVGAGLIYHAGQDAVTRELQPKIDILTSVVAADETTIKMMAADAKTNDELLAQYTDAIALLTKKTFDDLNAIRRLEQNDHNVSAYLHTPVPDALRSLLNDRASSEVGGKGRLPAPAKSPGSPLP